MESVSSSSTHFQIPSDPLKPIRDFGSENKEPNWSFGLSLWGMASKIGKGRCTEENFELEEHFKAGEVKKMMQENRRKSTFTCIFTWRMLCSSQSQGHISPPAVLSYHLFLSTAIIL